MPALTVGRATTRPWLVGIAAAAVCFGVAAIPRAGAQQGGPWPTGRPTYAQPAPALVPPAASTGRQAAVKNYVDAGFDLKGDFLAYGAQGPGDYLVQEFKAEADGLYEVALWMPKGPLCGMFVALVDGLRVGEEQDGYDAGLQGPKTVVLGEANLKAGPHRVQLLVTGRNPKSRGYELWLDAYLIRPRPAGSFITEWQIAGPFTGKSLKAQAPPANAAWRKAAAEQSGHLDLVKRLKRAEHAAAWARAAIHSPAEQATLLWIGSDDGVSVWLNGEKVHEYTGERPAMADQDRVNVRLRQGANQLLARVNNVKGLWGLYVRPQDPKRQLKFSLPEAGRAAPSGAVSGVTSGFAVQASPTERTALQELGQRVPGFVVWESNRTGQWELYRINTDGSGFRQLTHLSRNNRLPYKEYLRPRISPDGERLLFAYGKRGRPPEVWVASSESGDARKLTVGNPLNWSADGKEIYFVRSSQVWRYELATGKESLLHRAKVPVTGQKGGTVGMVRPDLKAAVFRASRRNQYFVFDQGKTTKTMGGCEPGFSADGRYLYWVQGPKDFRVWEIARDKEHRFLGQPTTKNWNYTYCPSICGDGRWLAYGASPNQHSHDTSDYEIFLQELQDWKPVGKPVRLSWHPRTDRWPSLWARR